MHYMTSPLTQLSSKILKVRIQFLIHPINHPELQFVNCMLSLPLKRCRKRAFRLMCCFWREHSGNPKYEVRRQRSISESLNFCIRSCVFFPHNVDGVDGRSSSCANKRGRTPYHIIVLSSCISGRTVNSDGTGAEKYDILGIGHDVHFRSSRLTPILNF